MGARVLIVGAGPAGLATAAALAAAGVRARLVDRAGVAGGAYARMDPAIVMTTPSALVSLPGLTAPHGEPYLTTGAYGRYLEAYAAHHRLVVERARVTALDRRGPGGYRAWLAHGDDGDVPADEVADVDGVVLATGMFDAPVRPAIDGLPADGPASDSRPRVVHAADWRVTDARAGERVLIVGGASSAVELAEACARAGAVTTVSARDGVKLMREQVLGHDPTAWLLRLLGRLPPALAAGFCRGDTVPATDRGFSALRRAGRLTVVPAVVRVEGRTAVLAGGRRLAVDVITLATGYRYAVAPAPADLARDERGVPRTRACESRSHPGLFVVGAPCVRRAASQYLYGMARDAPVVARALASRLSGQRTL